MEQTFEPEPVKRMVMKNGEKLEVIIPPEKYTAIRWMPSVPISKGETNFHIPYRS